MEPSEEDLPRLTAKIDPQTRDQLSGQFEAAKAVKKKAAEYMFALITEAKRCEIDAWNAVALSLGFESLADSLEKGYSMRVNYGTLTVEAFASDDGKIREALDGDED